MTSKTIGSGATAKTIDDIFQDRRLSRLFCGQDVCCALQLWILQIKTEEEVDSRLVYGRLIPYNHASNEWSASERDSFAPVRDVQVQVAKLNLYLHANLCSDLIRGLCAGRTLAEMSEQMGFVLPDKIKERFGRTTLSTGGLAYKPVTYLFNKSADNRGEPSSPHAESGSISASISQLEKDSLLDLDQGHGAGLIELVVNQLNTDTGLDFRHGDARRLGDLELAVFPALDDGQRSLLKVSRVASPHAVRLRFDPKQLPGFTGFQFRLCLRNDKEVICSETFFQERPLKGEMECAFELSAHLYEMTDSAELEIYGVTTDEPMRGELCCRWGATYVKQIDLRGHISGSSMEPIKLDWLVKKSSRKSTADRVAAALTPDRRQLAFHDEIGGRTLDPWVSANRKLAASLDRVNPPKSGGGFFPRIRDSNGEGRLLFVEWLKGVLAKHRQRRIVIFDPYFSATGLAWPFLSGAGATSYEVFTSLPKEVADGVPQRRKSDSTRQQRKIDLVTAAESIAHFTNGSRLLISGLKEGWLHDRYILVFDRKGEPIEGYHLSNSFEAASDKHPMLVTPIPADTLPAVLQYKDELLEKARAAKEAGDIASSPILELFDSSAVPQSKERPAGPGMFDHARSGDVLSIWADELSLRGLSGDALRDRMVDLGLVADDVFALSGLDKLRQCLAYSHGDFPKFLVTWPVIGNILANSPAGDASLRSLRSGGETLRFLAKFLEESFKREDDGDAAPPSVVRVDIMREPLDELLDSGHVVPSFIYPTRYPPLSWAEYYAIKALWECAPGVLLDIAARKITELPSPATIREAVPLGLLSQILSETAISVDYKVHDDQRDALLGSSVGVFRWLGLHVIEQQVRAPEHAEGRIRWIEGLPAADRVRTLGWLIQRAAVDTKVADSYQRLVIALHSTLPSSVTRQQLDEAVSAMRGHMMTLPWAAPWLFRDIIHPLLSAGRTQWGDASDIWMNELHALLDTRKDGVRMFSSIREGETTSVAAFLFAHSSEEQQSIHLKKLRSLLARLRRIIQPPLASTSDFGAWDDALMVTLWLHAFARLALFYLHTLEKDTQALESLCSDTLQLGRARSEEEWHSGRLVVGDLVGFLDWVNSLDASDKNPSVN